MDNGKERILQLFMQKVYGHSPVLGSYNSRHAGSAGHWLEKKLGKEPDASNESDFWGYECKNHTTSGKTTWGDWSANEYIFDKGNKYNLNRNSFFKIFGKPNIKKNRYSWSGEPVPTIPHKISSFGQLMTIDESLNIKISYDFSKDNRNNKYEIIPDEFRLNNLILAKWYGYEKNNESNKTALETKINKKFNQKGWFKCVMKNNVYKKIVFGKSMNFISWMKYLSSGDIFFDSGMYQGNDRPYSMWRSNNDFWEKLITEVFPKDV